MTFKNQKIKNLKLYTLAFKPSEVVHDSGFKCFDLAYYDFIKDEFIEITDFTGDRICLTADSISIIMDTLDGWTRVWDNKYLLEWYELYSTICIRIKGRYI